MASGATLTLTGGQDMVLIDTGNNDLVETTDFNNMRTNINALLGNPIDISLGGFTLSATYGLGQGGAGTGAAATSNTVSVTGANGSVRDLQDEIQELQTFLSQTSENVVDITAGSSINATDFNTMMLAVQDCWDGRFGGTPSSAVTDGSATYTTSWTNSISNEITYTFANETDCRKFFNGGGRLGISGSRSGGTAGDQNTRWTETLTAMGDVMINYNQGFAASATLSGVGFYDLTTSYQQIAEKFTATAPYTGDNVVVNAKINSTTNPTVVTFEVILTDAGDNNVDAPADGTFTINARRQSPDTTGTTFTFPTPTDGVGAITGS